MMEKKEAIKCPEDVLEAVIFKISKFPDEYPIEFYEQRGYPIRCIACRDEYDPENPEKIELVQGTATVMFNFQAEEGLVTIRHPWTTLYCKHCLLALFGKTDTGVANMFQ
ncbi:MAG: hypothetical protein WC410_00335 [Candidatus Paceibacterota bacterium]|nr:hypothetical protein [Candidatus Paceibacterota bacterium]